VSDTKLSFLYTPLTDDVLLWHVLAGLVGLIILVMIINAITRRGAVSHTQTHVSMKRCSSCGWSGKVGRLVTTCPKCNASIR